MTTLRSAGIGLAFFAWSAACSAQAENSTPSDLLARYQTMKAAVEQWFDEHPPISERYTSSLSTVAAVGSPSTVSGSPAAAAVSSSVLGAQSSDVIVTGDTAVFGPDPTTKDPDAKDPNEEMFLVAQTMGVLRRQLNAAGYPKLVYEGTIRKFEWDAAKAVSAGSTNPIYNYEAMQALVGDINAVRAQTYPSLPPVHYVAVAYATDVRPVILRSRPQGGRVWVITQLRFRVCKLSISNPYDTEKCPQWREADAKNPMYLAGTYAFQVRWGDGRKAEGERTIYNAGSRTPVVYDLP